MCFNGILLLCVLGKKCHLHVDKGLVWVTTKLVNDRIQDVLHPGMLDGVVGCKQNEGLKRRTSHI